jgi:3'-phosphoadenosine 5'-phosphosulfate sulfotransferase (PAPS reductase)/FAD synthetase
MQYESPIDLAVVGPLRAAAPAWRSRLERTRRTVRAVLADSARPYVSISGGKDSIAMLGVVAEVARELRREIVAWAHVSDASFPGTRETCVEACARVGVPLHLDESPVSAFEVVGQQSRQRFGKEGFFFGAIAAWVARGYDVAFVGVRAAESRRRRTAARVHGEVFETSVPVRHRRCHPLLWWSIEDVAAALWHYRLPIHPIYGKAALDRVPIRLGYVTALDLLASGTAVFLRRHYPREFARLAAAYPEVRTYV